MNEQIHLKAHHRAGTKACHTHKPGSRMWRTRGCPHRRGWRRRS
uniref:Uncharacterized protein n=1 Tax=Arundo donax TaxID=35708 RepID=A0A0A9CI06_ARUDO